MLMLKQTLQTAFIFAIASLAAYTFGFQTLFAHTAFEVVYYAGLFFSSLLIGNVFLNKILRIDKYPGSTWDFNYG